MFFILLPESEKHTLAFVKIRIYADMKNTRKHRTSDPLLKKEDKHLDISVKDKFVDSASAVKAVKMAKVSVRGGFNLFWGLVTSTVISALGVVLVARLLSPSEYGIVAIALTAPSLIAIFRDWGINSATIKYTAQYHSENRLANVRNIVAAGLLFELVLGLSLSLVSFALSGFLATNIFQRPGIESLIQIASFTILAGAFQVGAQSVFTGTERMGLISVTMVLQSVLKAVFSPLFIILGLGAFGAILGTTIAFMAAGLLGILILYLSIYKNLQTSNNDSPKIMETIKNMLKYGLPLSISTIISGFLSQFYNFLIAIYCVDLMIGNYQVATNFAVLITFFATPISTVLFPAFSQLDVNKENETLGKVFQFSVKYASLLVVPAATAVIILSQPGVSTLFGEKYTYAPLFLTLMSVSYLYSAFGNLSLGNLINSQGRTEVNLKLTLISSAIGLPLSLILIPNYGIIGLIATTLTAGIPSLITGLWWIKKHFEVTIDWASSAKILLSSTFAALITYVALSQLGMADWMKLAIGTITFTVSYMTATPLIGAINKTDIQNLKEMLKELGPLTKILNYPLNIMEKILFILQKIE